MEKEIKLTIINGKLVEHTVFEGVGFDTYVNDLRLKDIAVVIETLKKEQEKIMNKQKDEVQRLKVSNNTELRTGNLVLEDGEQWTIYPISKTAIKITWNKHLPNELMVLGYDKTGKEKHGTIKIDWD